MTRRSPATPETISPPAVPDVESRAQPPGDERLQVKGVLILGTRFKSRARRAGLKLGDVIIQYDGVGDLTIEKLAGVAKTMRADDSPVPVVVVRDGYKHSLTVPPGSLGIRAQDTTTQVSSQRNSDPEKQDAVPMFIFTYRRYKVCLRAILYLWLTVTFIAFLFLNGSERIHTVMDFLRFVLFQLILCFMLFGLIHLLVDMVLLKEVRIFKDRIVKVWSWGGPVEREVLFANARYSSVPMHYSNLTHMSFFREGTVWFLVPFKAIYYDESLVDTWRVKKLNRLLANLSGRKLVDMETPHLSARTFIKGKDA